MNTLVKYFLIIIVGFLSAQRFIFEDLFVYFFIFLIPLIYFEKDRDSKYSLFILLLFYLNDNGGSSYYAETHYLLRYFSVLLILFFVIFNSKIQIKKIFPAIFLILLYSFTTIFNDQTFDFNTFYRSSQILILIILLITIKTNFKLNYELLSIGILPVILSESINYFYFNDIYYLDKEYLSYNSLKTLIVFPLFYYSTKLDKLNKILFFTFLLILTTIIVIEYRQRMILVVLFLAIFVTFLKTLNFKVIIFMILGFISLPFIIENNYDFMIGSKNTFIFVQILESSNLLDLIKILDPVRYVEHLLFFQRDFISILLGEGLGSGLVDSYGQLNMISHDSTAFSQKEIDTSIYYNLHDTIPDIGLRFGLFFTLLIVFKIISGLLKKDYLKNILLLFLFFCSIWSLNGLIVFFLVFLSTDQISHNTNKI